MLKFSEIFEFSSEISYFERIRTVRVVRMVRMVRSLADRTFQLPPGPVVDGDLVRDGPDDLRHRRAELLLEEPHGLADGRQRLPGVPCCTGN